MRGAALAVYVAAVITFAWPPRCFATENLPDPVRARLIKFVGSYDCDALLADSLVDAQLGSLLGAELPHLITNIDVKGDIGFNSGMLVIQGNAPHRGGEEHGFIGISTYDGAVCAALLTEGKIVAYGRQSDYYALPYAMREWILATWAYVTLDGGPPPTVVLR